MQVGNYRFDPNMAMNIAEKVLWVVIILAVTWALAKAAKWAFAKLVDNVRFLQRHTGSGQSLGASLGKIVSLLIWLFGLIAVLNVLDLDVVAGPINSLLENVVSYIPRIVGAGLILFVGIKIAGIVRDLVVTALQTVDFDKWLMRGEAELSGTVDYTDATTPAATAAPAAATAGQGMHLSKVIGTIVYVLIVIPVALSALDVLAISAISEPASDMLRMILNAIPNVIGAALLLGIGYVLSKFVKQALETVLNGFGVDRSMAATGLVGETTSTSSILGRVAQVAIMLIAAVAATRLLGFPELTALVGAILELGAKVLFGAVVIGVGFLIANLLFRLIAGENGNSLAGSIVKWATIVVFTFMGLTFMEVGEEIVQLAFGSLVIGGGVAGALAFGLGGREWAGRKLEELDTAAKARAAEETTSASAPKAPTRKKAAPKGNAPLPPGA
ncbi:MAG: mechanosensitive ion channel [Parerythrobacter sp.]